MNEENTAAVRLRLEAPEGMTVRESESLTLVVEGPNGLVSNVAGIVYEYLATLGGKLRSITDENGNDLSPDVIDPLSTGDDSVA